jgi:hypothetical protein
VLTPDLHSASKTDDVPKNFALRDVIKPSQGDSSRTQKPPRFTKQEEKIRETQETQKFDARLNFVAHARFVHGIASGQSISSFLSKRSVPPRSAMLQMLPELPVGSRAPTVSR